MFERVRSARQQRAFAQTWEYFCRKNRWINDPYAAAGVRYLVRAKGRRWYNRRPVIGTVEFAPYDPLNPDSTVEGPAKHAFSAHADIRLHQSRIWEVDKLCLREEYQRKGYFGEFVAVFLDHARRYRPKLYLALVEGKFYRMLRLTFGDVVVPRGRPLVGPRTELVPCSIDMERLATDEGLAPRLAELAARSPAAR